ncbi:Hypothetical predicted protein [Pelobates cultripes]|uniref:Nucleolar protein 8 n=1 Tax=Pelobates cultripes TaxID=61616 RepID=A0AAD1WKX1_PELCU|nr:Hypothetical predicted protein [Pelobates cultripes]
MTPVSELTWQLEGGDNEISKKRRGEFPAYKSPNTKKLQLQKKNLGTEEHFESQKLKISQQGSDHVIKQSSSATQAKVSSLKILDDQRRGYRNHMSSDDEYDSGEELRAWLDSDKKAENRGNMIEDTNLEVVGDSFKMSYSSHWSRQDKNAVKELCKNAEDDEYDSADTDEIIAVSKNVKDVEKDTVNEKCPIPAKKRKLGPSDIQLKKLKPDITPPIEDKSESGSGNDDSASVSSDSYSDEEYESMQNSHMLPLSMGELEEPANKTRESSEDETERDENQNHSGSDSSDSYSDEEYDTMMQNCQRLTLSMADLEKLANEAKDSSEDETVNRTVESHVIEDLPSARKTPVVTQKVKKGMDPEDIVASILEDSDDSCDNKRKKKKAPPIKLPAFKGLGSLLTSCPSEESNASVNSFSNVIVSPSNQGKLATNKSSKVIKRSEIDVFISTKGLEQDPGSADNCEFSADQQGKDQAPNQPQVKRNKAEKLNPRRSSSSSEESSSSSDEGPSIVTSPPAPDKASQCISSQNGGKSETKKRSITEKLEDNKKRLAAMEERRIEREKQKLAIQGALLKLDSQSSSKAQHIKFDSDSEEESEEETKKSDQISTPSDKVQNPTPKLFDRSDEESDEGSTEDEERFQIKSQYEGRAGAKLLGLQSRFGTDERFRMDSRFLDTSSEDEQIEESQQKAQTSEAEDDLSAEKKKNLDILNSLLNINTEPQAPSKQSAKAKKFKDLNALQYDPTNEDHAAFETQTEETKKKKESKSERKKRRLEAEKLPEVSVETYHEVAVDLKEVFGTSKPKESEDPVITWDQEDETKKVGVENSTMHEYFSLQKSKEEEPAGFTFSFFGANTEDHDSKEVPYSFETINPAKVAWQEDPRFQDSSSEGEDEDDDNAAILTKEQTPSILSEASKSNIRFFFFVKDDERLKAGPKMFFPSSNLEEEEEVWEQRKESIMEECRKRHKDAKRKIRANH